MVGLCIDGHIYVLLAYIILLTQLFAVVAFHDYVLDNASEMLILSNSRVIVVILKTSASWLLDSYLPYMSGLELCIWQVRHLAHPSSTSNISQVWLIINGILESVLKRLPVKNRAIKCRDINLSEVDSTHYRHSDYP